VLPEQPLTVLAEAAHLDVSWGKVSFIATSTGDAAQSNAQILEQACVATYDKILIVCASFIFDLDTPFDSAHRDLFYEAISTSI